MTSKQLPLPQDVPVIRTENQLDPNLPVQAIVCDPMKINRFVHPARMILAGPTGSGKSTFMYNLLKYRDLVFSTKFESIFYCVYSENMRSSHSFINELKAICPKLEIVMGMPTSKLIMTHPLPKIFLLDDMMSELKSNKFVQNLFTRDSRHENCSFVVATQSYFDANLIIRHNCNYKVLFNDPTSDLVLRGISGQLKKKSSTAGTSFLSQCLEIYQEYFPNEQHPYIVVDSAFDSGNKETRYRSNVFPVNDTTLKIRPIVFYKNPRYNM